MTTSDPQTIQKVEDRGASGAMGAAEELPHLAYGSVPYQLYAMPGILATCLRGLWAIEPQVSGFSLRNAANLNGARFAQVLNSYAFPLHFQPQTLDMDERELFSVGFDAHSAEK